MALGIRSPEVQQLGVAPPEDPHLDERVCDQPLPGIVGITLLECQLHPDSVVRDVWVQHDWALPSSGMLWLQLLALGGAACLSCCFWSPLENEGLGECALLATLGQQRCDSSTHRRCMVLRHQCRIWTQRHPVIAAGVRRLMQEDSRYGAVRPLEGALHAERPGTHLDNGDMVALAFVLRHGIIVHLLDGTLVPFGLPYWPLANAVHLSYHEGHYQRLYF